MVESRTLKDVFFIYSSAVEILNYSVTCEMKHLALVVQ